jgi:hypothetical protein
MADTFVVEPDLPLEDALLFEPFRPEERAPSPPLPRPRVRLPPRPGRVRAPPVLPSAPALFPWLARGLAPGEATLWCGPRLALDPILEMLYAGSALVRGRISLLEGANRFHPYRIGELGRALGLDAGETLRRIRLARAFTAHQMVALVEGWAREARRHPPTLLVGHDLPTLFLDGEIADDERDALLRHVARTLAALLAEIRVPLLLTLGPDGPDRFSGLSDDGPRWADLVLFERGPTSLRARALRDDARLVLVPRGAGQKGIEEFGDPPSAEEVIGWDVPRRPTARRSRRG